MTEHEEDWVPDACTLPTVQRPVRLAEFDALFAADLREQRRLSPTRLRWRLEAAAEARVRDLTRRESECCSFFTFTVTPATGAVLVDVQVPAEHVAVLDALTARAAGPVP